MIKKQKWEWNYQIDYISIDPTHIREFMNRQWKSHVEYNKDWQKRNWSIIFLSARVKLEKLLDRGRWNILKRQKSDCRSWLGEPSPFLSPAWGAYPLRQPQECPDWSCLHPILPPWMPEIPLALPVGFRIICQMKRRWSYWWEPPTIKVGWGEYAQSRYCAV